MEANRLFATNKHSARMPTAAYGSYTRGCLAGAARLLANGPHWQVMRMSRNRYWGHPRLLDYIERLSADAARLDGWSGLLVGDISQPRGGPLLSGHKSHQIGLDVDIWFRPSPQKKLSFNERESWSANSMINSHFNLNQAVWTDAHSRLLKRAASDPDVARIFVHPTIKKELCDWAGGNRTWLRKIRGWYGHDDHFHVRLDCPAGERACTGQDQPRSGDGCGDDLAWWFSTGAYRVKPQKGAPAPPLTLADLPAACEAVLESE
ncbi:MAG: penicillin-insensitive murein endopeptidase [Methylococcaceae bacterium]|nr:penicillin-insensitive murein endopeptidase [Methylococcaceae bacterium]